jgi:hypothetical protein
MPLSDMDKIYWFRVGMGFLAGALADVFFGIDYANGILVALIFFLGSYYLSRFLWGKSFAKEQMNKLYTTGMGSYVMLFLFSWLLLFTLGVHYLTLVVAAAAA